MKPYPLSYGAARLALSKGAHLIIIIQMILDLGDPTPRPEFTLQNETVVLTLFTSCSHSIDSLLADPRLLAFKVYFEKFGTYSHSY